MKKGPRVVVLVSPDISDIYFANQLASRLNVVGIFVEKQNEEASDPFSKFTRGLKYLVKPHLIGQRIKEGLYGRELREKADAINYEGFGDEGCEINVDESVKVVYTEGINAINDSEYVEQVRELEPDIIAVCGTSILKKEMISVPAHGTLNLHGGLSQWYRGVWTTLWAIYNEEPEYVGCTVHYVSPGIDDGNIVYQGRPEVSANDNHESLYVKVVKLGVELMIKAIEEIGEGRGKGHALKQKGKLYLKRHVTPEVMKEVWEKIDRGVVKEYLDDKLARDSRVDIYIHKK